MDILYLIFRYIFQPITTGIPMNKYNVQATPSNPPTTMIIQYRILMSFYPPFIIWICIILPHTFSSCNPIRILKYFMSKASSFLINSTSETVLVDIIRKEKLLWVTRVLQPKTRKHHKKLPIPKLLMGKLYLQKRQQRKNNTKRKKANWIAFHAF